LVSYAGLGRLGAHIMRSISLDQTEELASSYALLVKIKVLHLHACGGYGAIVDRRFHARLPSVPLKGHRSHNHNNGNEHGASRGHPGSLGGGTGAIGAPPQEGVGNNKSGSSMTSIAPGLKC